MIFFLCMRFISFSKESLQNNEDTINVCSKIRDRVWFFIIDVPILVKFADRDRTLSRLIVYTYIYVHITLKSFPPVLFYNI